MDKLVRKIEVPLARAAIKKAGLYLVGETDIDKSKLYIRHIEPEDTSSVGGVYACGRIEADITTIGSYEVAVDTIPPVLLPVNEDLWMSKGVLTLSF